MIEQAIDSGHELSIVPMPTEQPLWTIHLSTTSNLYSKCAVGDEFACDQTLQHCCHVQHQVTQLSWLPIRFRTGYFLFHIVSKNYVDANYTPSHRLASIAEPYVHRVRKKRVQIL